MANGPRIGKVVHFFDKIGVAVVALEADLKVGDRVQVLGNQTDFVQTIASMQVEHQAVSSGKAGTEVAVKLDQPARRGDALMVPAAES
jgi:ligand-binding sensor protein